MFLFFVVERQTVNNTNQEEPVNTEDKMMRMCVVNIVCMNDDEPQ